MQQVCQEGRAVDIDRNVLNDLIRRSHLSTRDVARELSITSHELFLWRYSSVAIPPQLIRQLAIAIGATIQELLRIPAESLVDMTELSHGRLVVFDDRKFSHDEDESMAPIRMRDRAYKPVRRPRLYFGADGLLMAPISYPPAVCSCGQPVHGRIT